jgi:acetate kinase
MADAILTLNAGSSSLKFSLFEIGPSNVMKLISHGLSELEGQQQHFLAKDPAGKVLTEERWIPKDQHFQPVLEHLIEWTEGNLGQDHMIAVGHRVVHGGADHDRPELVTKPLLEALDRLTPLAPLHEPHNLAPIRAIMAARPNLPQVACFDTAFHHTMPVVATRFALPREYEEAGVRRYGFHGLSYEYISRRLRDIAPALAKSRVIAAHLGNGASLCAMQDGRSVDTTMGFTALDGLMMGTRCGALDPGVILYLEQQRGMTAKQIEDLLYKQSGLLGVSGGISSDMRNLLASKDPRADEAVELFVFRIVREIGALTSSLGGLEGIIFTAGIGEHAPEIRARVCARLGWLGVALDEKANARDGDVISTPQSRVAVRVVPTNEEAMIAHHTLDTIRQAAPAGL